MKVASAWSGHDCSFCILDNGHPIVHAEYERYIREKEPAGDGVQFMFDEYKAHRDIKYFATNYSFSKLESHPESLGKLKGILKIMMQLLSALNQYVSFNMNLVSKEFLFV